MAWGAFRWTAAAACALAFHSGLIVFALCSGLLSHENVELPELDLTSVELSLSDEPDETKAPAMVETQRIAAPPVSEIKPSGMSVPKPMESLPEAAPVPNPPLPRRIDRSFEPPEPKVSVRMSASGTSPAAPSQAGLEALKPPSAVEAVKPKYPRGARERKEEGLVVLDLKISAFGIVEGVKIAASCGFKELEEAAVNAVRMARFKPARKGGDAVPCSTRITLEFRLK